ncbi:MAG: efflux RND transporter periplasmic adaptor subunit [Rikenellaceae bacterium]
MIKRFIPIAMLLLAVACGSNNTTSTESSEKSDRKSSAPVVRENLVDTMMLSKTMFNKEITCNGRLRAIEKVDLRFEASGRLDQVLVYNGDEVAKGALLGVINTEDAEINLSRAQLSYRKAQMDLADKLIAQGYEADTLSVPADILMNIKVSSGYINAEENYDTAKRRLEDCYLYAPFAGRVANQNSKRYQNPDGGVFCTLINDSYFDVEFNVLEAEFGDISKGQEIVVSTFVNEDVFFSGEVTQINPVIDDNGQIKIRAKVKNRDGLLIEGMNVKLVIRRKIENAYVVPKDAVLSRDGFFVIFKYVDDRAVWTYVDVVMSNIDSHVISASYEKQSQLDENDIIITSGNINLSDGSSVKLLEAK